MSDNIIKQFHFIEPLWLLGLIPVLVIAWLLFKHQGSSQSAWKNIIDARFLPYLLVKQGAENNFRLPIILLSTAWVLAVLALANPSWKSIPQPVFQQPDAQVIVFSLSTSMLASDVKPSRLIQARYKIENILRHSQGKQTGLIVYAGDAFTVTPLTDDIATLKSQLRVLEPSLMPAPGNRPDRALQQAERLLHQAGYQQGNIILITDIAGSSAIADQTRGIAKQLAQNGYSVSVLSIGREDNNKQAKAALQEIAQAGHGIYAAYTGNQQDVNAILSVSNNSAVKAYQGKIKNKQANRPVQEGPWLAVLLLPLALLAFRRGWLFVFPLILLGPLFIPQPAMAFGWDDLWQRPDQQAAQAFNNKDYNKAASLAPNKLMQGSAQYRSGHYQQAVESFSQKKDAQSAYNLGNALAHTGDYKKAINAYDQALKQQPNMQDALANRKLIEDLLKQKQKQQQKNQQNKQQKKGKGKGKGKNQKRQANKNSQPSKNKGKNGQQSANKSNQKSAQQSRKSAAQKSTKQSTKQANSKKNSQKKQAQDQNSSSKKPSKNASLKKSDVKQKQQQNKPPNKPGKSNNSFAKAGSREQQKKANQTVKKAQQRAEHKKPSKGNMSQAKLNPDKLSPEERESVENWLRRVPDDPGGLLRRKFLYQYQQRQQR